jgi:hypothetical protein
VAARHGLVTSSALRALFDSAQRSYGDYLEDDDICSAIAVRKRVRCAASSDSIARTPSVDNIRPTTRERDDPLAQVWISKPGRAAWMDIITRAHLRATGKAPGQLAPGRSVPDLSRPGTQQSSRPGTRQRGSRPGTRASMRSRGSHSRPGTRQSRPYSRSSLQSRESYQSWASSERSPMPMSPLDRVASAIRVFHRDVTNVENLKNKKIKKTPWHVRQQQKQDTTRTEVLPRVPARRPGVNSVLPLPLTTLGFSQRFQFSRLDDHMNRVQEENKAMRAHLAASAPVGVIKDKDLNGRLYTKNTLRMQQRTRKRQLQRSTKAKEEYEKSRVCEFSLPASHYFAPLQREKAHRASAFTISKPPTLEQWQQKDHRQRAELRHAYERSVQGEPSLCPESSSMSSSSSSSPSLPTGAGLDAAGLKDSTIKWVEKNKRERNRKRRERKRRVAREGEEAVRASEIAERLRKDNDVFVEMQKDKAHRSQQLLERKSSQFSIPVPDPPANDMHRLRIEAASQNDTSGDLRGEALMRYSFRAKYDPWISVGVRRPRMNLTPSTSQDFGNPPELPWEGPGSGAFRCRSQAKGSWFSDYDLENDDGGDVDGEGIGLEGNGFHAESRLPVQIGGDPRMAALRKWNRQKEKRRQKVAKTRFGKDPAYDKPKMVLENLGVNAGGDGCFGEAIKLEREPLFTNWRRPAKRGAAAR